MIFYMYVGQDHQEEEGHHLEGHHRGGGQGRETDIGLQAERDLRGVPLRDVATLHPGGGDPPPPDLDPPEPGGLKRVEDGKVPVLPENRGECISVLLCASLNKNRPSALFLYFIFIFSSFILYNHTHCEEGET